MEKLIHETWQAVPRWHYRRWIGYPMRRWVWGTLCYGGPFDGQWEYATHRQVAHSYLEAQFNQVDVHESSLTSN